MLNFTNIDTQIRLTAGNGSFLLSGSGASLTGICRYSFIPQEDTILSVLSGSNSNFDGVDLLSKMGINGKVLRQNSLHSCNYNENITSITIASGSVILY